MVEWLKYAVRVAAAFLLAMMSLVCVAVALAGKDRQYAVFAFAGIFVAAAFATWPRRPNVWRHDPPTERQLAYALDLGIRVHPRMSKGELSDLISAAKAGRDE